MNAVQLRRIDENLPRLRLFKSRERLEALLRHAAAEELSHPRVLSFSMVRIPGSRSLPWLHVRDEVAGRQGRVRGERARISLASEFENGGASC